MAEPKEKIAPGAGESQPVAPALPRIERTDKIRSGKVLKYEDGTMVFYNTVVQRGNFHMLMIGTLPSAQIPFTALPENFFKTNG